MDGYCVTCTIPRNRQTQGMRGGRNDFLFPVGRVTHAHKVRFNQRLINLMIQFRYTRQSG